MIKHPLLIEGVFVSELKNRFRCLVTIGNEKSLCYVPSSCKLENFINLAGCKVWLRIMEAESDIRYALYAAETHKGIILLNLALANEILAEEIRRRYFSFLGKRKHIRREVVIDSYKCDLYIEDSDTIVEIKTVMTLERKAHFPTVCSERSLNQLRKIGTLLDKGHRVLYMFVSLGPWVKSICLDSDEKYVDLFKQCTLKGMMYGGCALRTTVEGSKVLSRVPIEIMP